MRASVLKATDVTSQSDSHQSGLLYPWLLHHATDLTLRTDIGELTLSANVGGTLLLMQVLSQGHQFCKSVSLAFEQLEV